MGLHPCYNGIQLKDEVIAMSRVSYQKTKLFHLLHILYQDTDDDHCLSVPELVERLKGLGVSVERKSIYSDIETLRALGYDVDLFHNKGYRLLGRMFELAELKLLVDAVQSSRFIPANKSGELIGKLEKLASRYEAQSLQRQVFVARRVKSMNKSIFVNIDNIHQAVSQKRQITFRYFKHDRQRQRVYRHGGRLYRVSPFTLLRSNDNYYLIAYDDVHGEIRHYRVDKMDTIQITDLRCLGEEAYQSLDLGAYERIHFGMFRGRIANVELYCENDMADILIDRFGDSVHMAEEDSQHFTASVRLAVSPQFYGWLCGLGEFATLVGPDWVVEGYRNHLDQVRAKQR